MDKKPAKKGAMAPATKAILLTSGPHGVPKDAADMDREMYEKKELRRTTPLLKAYREKHGIAEATKAERRLPELEKEQTVHFTKQPAKKSAAGKVLGGKEKKSDQPKETGGMGTPVAEYSEAGPFSCGMCWYLQSQEPRQDPLGLCNEPHMLRDPKTEKTTEGGTTFAIVDKVHGCCRFIDPVKPTEPREEFVFAGDSEEEAEEHGHEDKDEGTESE